MMERFRAYWTNLLNPIVQGLLKAGVSPDAVTLVGTLGVAAGALIFFPQGQLLIGVLVITAFVFSDMVDGAMARASGRTSLFGNFLDSTLDRLGDAAIFGGLAMFYVNTDAPWLAALAIFNLTMGSVTSYARAKAESLGMHAKVGIAERADRLVAILIVTGVSDLVYRLGVDQARWAIVLTLMVLAVASTITVVQRILVVREQANALARPAAPPVVDDGA